MSDIMHRGLKDGEQFNSPLESSWHALYLIGFYRLALAVIFIISYLFLPVPSLLGKENPIVFFIAANIYLIYALFSIMSSYYRTPTFNLQVYIHSFVDIFIITICMHVSGGVDSGLGMLLVVTVASVGVLCNGRVAFIYATSATLIVTLEQTYRFIWFDSHGYYFVQTGLLCATFFISAILSNVLAKQLRDSEVLAAQRGVDLVNMGQLNEFIIQRMGSGVLVVDNQMHIRLMNEAAWYLLGMPAKDQLRPVADISSALDAELKHWLEDNQYEAEAFRVSGASAIYPRFIRLGMQDYAGTLIILEDTSFLDQQAQHLKLTALGRLTASIAHEIRNPLGAISHASQLLEESTNLDQADRRLTQIIREQSVRMNVIIENVMQLSRRDKAVPEQILLKPWLEGFVIEFCRVHDIELEKILLEVFPNDLQVSVDPSHLHQILWNLSQNGLRHGLCDVCEWILEIKGGELKDSHSPYLDVIDHGSGVSAEMVEQIFEPFFTTAAKGTGLGLYIARELAEANHAHLDYLPDESGGSCFRLTFSSVKRRVR